VVLKLTNSQYVAVKKLANVIGHLRLLQQWVFTAKVFTPEIQVHVSEPEQFNWNKGILCNRV